MKGDRLAEVRSFHGDTQATLAEKLNVTRFTVASWEQEKSSPSHEMLVKICRMYDVSSDFLLDLTRTERPQGFTRDEEAALVEEFEEFLRWRRLRHNKKK